MNFNQYIAASTAISTLYLGNDRVVVRNKVHPVCEGYITIIYVDDIRECDFICHDGSYGHEDGLLEGGDGPFVTEEDTVMGFLTATEVVRMVTEYVDNILKRRNTKKG